MDTQKNIPQMKPDPFIEFLTKQIVEQDRCKLMTEVKQLIRGLGFDSNDLDKASVLQLKHKRLALCRSFVLEQAILIEDAIGLKIKRKYLRKETVAEQELFERTFIGQGLGKRIEQLDKITKIPAGIKGILTELNRTRTALAHYFFPGDYACKKNQKIERRRAISLYDCHYFGENVLSVEGLVRLIKDVEKVKVYLAGD